MGQQSLYIKNRLSILKDTQNRLLKSADNKYLKDHFKVDVDFDEDILKHDMLIEYALCTPNCEVIDWVWCKINGVIDNKKYYEFDLIPQQTNINIYNITNYVKENCTWETVEW